ncbi:hypothetical protein K439DRAFT_1248933, partial [Ramaria rubella]
SGKQNINNLITDTILHFKLCPEQERAFSIIANHAIKPQQKQLKMYIVMAGTGKSQVVKALRHFFVQRNEVHRLKIVAPTRSAAALIGGSTYHLLLEFQEKEEGRTSATALSNVKTRLRHCEYILLDEVSMLSCQNLYDISKRLALA